MIIPKNNEALPMERYPTPVIGRLIAMPTTNGHITVADLSNTKGGRNVVSFDFPSMPDVIELARSADYYTNYSPIMPDGMHQYRGTKPLEIPLTFKLHAMDRTYCPYGAVTLLQLAARLHSFVLPLTPDGSTAAQVQPLFARDYIVQNADGKPLTEDQRKAQVKTLGAQTENDQLYSTSLNTPISRLNLSSGYKGVPFPPVTCLLNLIWVAEDQPGIACIGYVRDVRVRLMGPWLRGPTGEYNLPTAGEFEFTFIHRPSHNNSMGFNTDAKTGQFQNSPALPEMQAFATDVRNQLYNTRNLVLRADYHGFTAEGTPDAVKATLQNTTGVLRLPSTTPTPATAPVTPPIDLFPM